MQLFADAEFLLEDLLAPGAQITRVPPENLSPSTHSAWTALGSSLTCCTANDDTWPSSFPQLIAVKDAIGSQFSAVQEAVHNGSVLPRGLVAFAYQGTGFRGQRDRAWIALAGNLHGCWYRRIDSPVDSLGTGLTMLPTVAVTDALFGICCGQVPLGIKWVNDVLWNGQKIAGSLVATRIRNHRVKDILIGIGVNIESAPEISGNGHMPAAFLRKIPGCEDVTWSTILKSITKTIDHRLGQLIQEGPEELYTNYLARSSIIGHRVQLWPIEECSRPFAAGTVTKIDGSLRLHLDTQDHPIAEARLTLDP